MLQNEAREILARAREVMEANAEFDRNFDLAMRQHAAMREIGDAIQKLYSLSGGYDTPDDDPVRAVALRLNAEFVAACRRSKLCWVSGDYPAT